MEAFCKIPTLSCPPLLPFSTLSSSKPLLLPTSTTRRSKSSTSFKALQSTSPFPSPPPSSSNSRITLSSSWNVLGGPSMPRMEELDATNMFLRQRTVFLGSQLDDTTADLIISQLLFLDAQDHEKDIVMLILCPGGSTSAAMGVYDTMKLCKADISTVCIGIAASMAAFLLAAGTKGKRYCMPNSRVMVHQPPGYVGGNATMVGIMFREMMYQNIKLNKILSRITGKTEQQIDIDTKRDFFMNPWEAKEYGLVDIIIDEDKPGLVAPIAERTPPPDPEWWEYVSLEMDSTKLDDQPSELKLKDPNVKRWRW